MTFGPQKRSLHIEKNHALFQTDEEGANFPTNREVAECIYSHASGQRYLRMNMKEFGVGAYCLYGGSEDILLAHICIPFYKDLRTGIEFDDFDRPNPFPRSFFGADGYATFLVILRRMKAENATR